MFGLIKLLLMLIAVGVLLVAALVVIMARGLVRPRRMTDGKAIYVLKRLSPGDLAMPFEDVRWRVRDSAGGGEISIAGWWIPHPAGSRRTCVIVHGYADAKVGGIAWAPTWRDLGFNVLAIDLRAHGESGGTYTTAGYLEREDLSQVIDQLRAARPNQAEQVVLFGISLGAAVVAAVGAMREDLAAVVMESPYGHFVRAAARHGRAMGMPLVRFQPMIARLAGWMTGADYDQVAPVNLIGQVRCPLMLIHSADDPLIDPADVQALRDAVAQRDPARRPSIYWEAPEAYHVMGLAVDPEGYRHQLAAFIAAVDGAGSTAEASRPSTGMTGSLRQ